MGEGRGGGEPVVVLLAGGLARRMGGGDKGLCEVGGRPILAHVVERLARPGRRMVLNVNGDPARFAGFGLPIAADTVEGFAGPLAGVLAGMRWTAANAPGTSDVVTLPTDGPFVPRDLIKRLVAGRAAQGTLLACAASKGRRHPVIGLWPVRLADELEQAMTEEGIRKVDVWTARHPLAVVDFPAEPVDPFFNANTAADLVEAERLMARAGDRPALGGPGETPI